MRKWARWEWWAMQAIDVGVIGLGGLGGGCLMYVAAPDAPSWAYVLAALIMATYCDRAINE